MTGLFSPQQPPEPSAALAPSALPVTSEDPLGGRAPRRRVARAHQEVSIPLRVSTVEEGVARIRSATSGRPWGALGTLWVRVRDDGRVNAGRHSGRSSAYPTFEGRLVTDPLGRVRLDGTVRESCYDLLWVAMFAFVTLMMGSFLVGLVISAISSGDPVWPGIGVCGVSTVAFALIATALRRQRRGFPLAARELVALMASHLPR